MQGIGTMFYEVLSLEDLNLATTSPIFTAELVQAMSLPMHSDLCPYCENKNQSV